MTKNKRFVLYEHKGAEYILDTPNTELDFIEMLGDCLDEEEIVDLLNELHEENQQLKKEYNSLQRTAYKIDAIAYEDREYSERLYKQNQQLEKEISKLKCINKQLEDRLENSGIGIALDMEECE